MQFKICIAILHWNGPSICVFPVIFRQKKPSAREKPGWRLYLNSAIIAKRTILKKMIFIFLIFFREIFGQNRLNANSGIYTPDIFGGMEVLEENFGSVQPRFGSVQPRFNASCDEWSLNAALECEAEFAISLAINIIISLTPWFRSPPMWLFCDFEPRLWDF